MGKRAIKAEFIFNKTPIECQLQELQPLRFVLVSKTPLEAVWDYAVSEYHYLGYDMMIGPRLKYMVFSGINPLAAISFNQAAYKVGCRDCFIGWGDEQRLKHLPLVVNNNRFLIMPWVRVKNLASHVLSQSIKFLRKDWPVYWNIEPILIETFVDAIRYKGTCYQAANWVYLGETQGYARKGGLYKYHGNRKGVYLYPLRKDFRNIIGCTLRPYNRALSTDDERRSKTVQIQTNEWNPNLIKDAGITINEVERLGQLLLDFHNDFSDCYSHKNQMRFAETYLMGLMSNLERKSAEPIALCFLGEDNVRGLQRFFKDSPWDFAKMKKIYQQKLSSVIADTDAMMTIDASDFPKKGKESAGVARQHCGALGKTENCQCGVFVGYTSKKGYGLVDTKLYMPERWFDGDYAERRKDCAVPADLDFMTRIEIALELVHRTRETDLFPAKWLGCDSFFGRNTSFIDNIADNFIYFADILNNMLVFPRDTEVITPVSKGKSERQLKTRASKDPIAVSEIAVDDNIPWTTVVLGESSKGPIISDIKCIRVRERRDGLPGREVWLYIRRFSDGKIKCSLSNAPADTTPEVLNQVSLMRWPIEQCFEECKSELGMDHYEIRSYPGWHRHMIFVFLAQLFLLEVRLMFKKNTNTDAFTCENAGNDSLYKQN